jgi:hypothetical protein
MGQTSPSTTGTYIYCIARAQPFEQGGSPFTAPGIGGRDKPVRLLTSDDLAAVVSDAPRDGYDVTRENLLAHQRVITQAMTRSDVLPVSFGTVAESDQQVQEQLLRGAAGDLHRALAAVQGCIELDLKVLWNEERLFASLGHGDVAPVPGSVGRRPPPSRSACRPGLIPRSHGIASRRRGCSRGARPLLGTPLGRCGATMGVRCPNRTL